MKKLLTLLFFVVLLISVPWSYLKADPIGGSGIHGIDWTTVGILGGTIDGTPIGATTPSTGAFTTLSATGNVAGATYGSDSSISDAELLTLDDGATTEILVGGGAGSAPVWTTATGTGAPVRENTPTLVTPEIGAATATSLVASGNVVGEVPITLDTDATISLAVTDCRGHARFNNDADVIDYTLPAAEAGLTILIYDIAGGVITIDPVDGTDTIYLNGTSVGAGDAIDSPGAVGDFIALMAIDATRWVTVGRAGTWVDGGVD